MDNLRTKFYNFIYLLIFLSTNFFLSQTRAKVVGIKDGDTVVVLLSDNTQKTLRLAEVDCPESGQPFGKNAKQFTSDQIFGKSIEFLETDKDRYGRSIAKIYYDNKYLSQEIIKSGLGWWYFRYSNNKKLGELENTARNKKVGLWIDTRAVAPWDFRKFRNQN